MRCANGLCGDASWSGAYGAVGSCSGGGGMRDHGATPAGLCGDAYSSGAYGSGGGCWTRDLGTGEAGDPGEVVGAVPEEEVMIVVVMPACREKRSGRSQS